MRLWQIVQEELRSARSRLGGDEDRDMAIHQARRSLKKARSALKLMQSQLGARYSLENSWLRDIGLSLSALRDAAAVIETFDRLRRKYRGRVRREVFQAARAGLVNMKQEVDSQEDVADLLRNAAENLSKTRRPWQLKADGLSAIAQALETTFRKGRKALERVHKHPRPENFHALRKRVKTYRFQLRLVPGEKTSEKRLGDLDRWLGEAHNLTLLEERFAGDRSRFGVVADVRQILGLIAKRQKELRAKSLTRAEEIYA